MKNSIELKFDRMGLSWKVEVIEDNGSIDEVVAVYMHNGSIYVEVEVDCEQFMKDMGEILFEELEDYLLNERLAHEDMMYETAREEGRL